ncbi:MAG: hypothetical protein WBC09_14075, partial [Thermoanaerobaculia bacterium]
MGKKDLVERSSDLEWHFVDRRLFRMEAEFYYFRLLSGPRFAQARFSNQTLVKKQRTQMLCANSFLMYSPLHETLHDRFDMRSSIP